MCARISTRSLIFWTMPIIISNVVPQLAMRIQQVGIDTLKQEDGLYQVLTFLADEKCFSYLLGGSLALSALWVLGYDLYNGAINFNRLHTKKEWDLFEIIVTDS